MIRQRSFAQVAAELELVSHGQITAYNSSGGPNNDERLLPPGELHPPHEHFRHLHNEAVSDLERETVLRDAENALRALKRRQAPVQPIDETKLLRDRILQAKDWPAKDVSQALRCSVTIVRTTRIQAGQSPERGRFVDGLSDDVRARARELAAEGFSQRQIRLLTGLARDTIRKHAA